MKKPLFAVKDIVQITGITARTLHYYDRIDLFKPTHLTEKGYRLYDRSSLKNFKLEQDEPAVVFKNEAFDFIKRSLTLGHICSKFFC